MMSAEDYKIVVLLKGISITGIPARTFKGASINAFIEVSVDGEQQWKTDTKENNLDPQWSFSRPRLFDVHPSSALRFTLYRKHSHMPGNKELGTFEAPLFDYISQGHTDTGFSMEIKHVIHSSKADTCALKVQLTLDASDHWSPKDDMIQDAADKLQNISIGQSGISSSVKTTNTALLEALDNLDQLVKVVDDLTEAHPWCKVAWTLLSAVYKAVRGQRERDGKVKELSVDLRDALARARHCRNLKAIPGATNVVKSLAQLVAEGATLIDEYLKRPKTAKYVHAAVGLSSTLDARIEKCQKKLHDLYQVLALDLNIHQFQQSSSSDRQTGQAGRRRPTPTLEVHEPHGLPSRPNEWNASPSPPSAWNMSHASSYDEATRRSGLPSGPHRQSPHDATSFPSPYTNSDYGAPWTTSPDSTHQTFNVPYPTPTSPFSKPKSKYQSLPVPQPHQHQTPQPPPTLHPNAQGSDWGGYGGQGMLGIPFTSAPLPITPELSRGSSNVDNSDMPATPNSEQWHHSESGGAEGQGAYFKDIGGFTMPGTELPDSTDHSRRHTLQGPGFTYHQGWVPRAPL